MTMKISVLVFAFLSAVSGMAHAQQPAASALVLSPQQVKAIGERVKQDLGKKSIAQVVAELKNDGFSASSIATALLLAGVDAATTQASLVADGLASQEEASAVVAVATVDAAEISSPTAAGPVSGGTARVPTSLPATILPAAINSGSSFGGGGGGGGGGRASRS